MARTYARTSYALTKRFHGDGSRAHFADWIRFLNRLGFEKRERFYAGAEAGWGAQISEQPVTGIVIFADVDLTPDETEIDFSVKKLPPATSLGSASGSPASQASLIVGLFGQVIVVWYSHLGA